MAQFQSFDPVGAFQGARRNALSIQSQQQGIDAEAAAAPVRNELNQLKTDQFKAKSGQDESLRKLDVYSRIAKGIKAAGFQNLPSIAPKLEAFAREQGVELPPGGFANLTEEQNDQFIATSNAQLAPDLSKGTTAQRDRGSLIKAIQPALDKNGNFDPKKANAEQLSAAMELGIVAKSGTQTGKERVATTEGLTKTVAESEAIIEGEKAGAKEAAKLKVQFKLKPEVEAAVASALSQVKADAAIAKEQRSNGIALNMYETAMDGLVASLSGTITGPGVGFIPALTSNAQIANGAVAAITPVLKQLFRTAGEGTFTDKDQDLLTAMVPTRNDLPATRVAKISNIDAIIRAKLSEPDKQTDQPRQGGVLHEDANGNRAMVFPDGSIEELN